ncbi:MAG: hypothetical protein ACRC3J_09240 [Culicoidibacterales bacterium]
MIKIKRSEKLAAIIEAAVDEQFNQYQALKTSNQGCSIDVMKQIVAEFHDSHVPAVRAIVHEIRQFDEQFDALKYAKSLTPTARLVVRMKVRTL